MKSIALKKAVKYWQMRHPLEGEHLSDSTLGRLLEQEGDETIYKHLSLCNLCRKRLWKFQDSAVVGDTADDYVLPLAANVGIPEEVAWITADKKYRIEFRRMVSEKAERAVLIVRVQAPFNFTGKTIVVRDANQRILLRGQISEDGKAAAIVEEFESLVLKKITVTED